MFRPFRQWPAFFRAIPSSRVQARHLRSARLRARPQCSVLERLEERAVPAVIPLTVTSLADTGAGTLRSAITTADTGDPTDSYVINIATPGTITMDATRPRRTRDRARQRWHARHRQRRFARFLGFSLSDPAACHAGFAGSGHHPRPVNGYRPGINII